MPDSGEAKVSSLKSATRSLALDLIASLVIFSFGVILALSFFFPVYIDDILWPITNSRAGYDGWKTIHIFPQCGKGFATDIPITLFPGRFIAWLIDAAITGYYSMRLVAICTLLCWIGYLTWFLRRWVLTALPTPYILAGIIGFAALGTLPFPLLIDRPETPMLAVIAFYVSLPFIIKSESQYSLKAKTGITILFILVTSWFISIHPKALFYAPLAVISAIYIGKWQKFLGWALSAFSLLACWQSFQYWQLKLECPDSAFAKHQWDEAAVNPMLFFQNKSAFMRQILANLFSSPVSYLKNMLFLRENYWMPPTSGLIGDILANIAILAVGLSCLIFVFRNLRKVLFHAARDGKLLHPALSAAICLFAAFLAQCAIQKDKSFYNTELVWATLVLCSLMLFHYLWVHGFLKEIKTISYYFGFSGLGLASLLSQIVFLLNYLPAMAHAYANASPSGIFKDKWVLISLLHENEVRQNILSTAQICNIPIDHTDKHIVVDTITYLTFKATFQPYIYTLFTEFPHNSKPFLTFLQNHDSSGLLTECTHIPGDIRPFTKQHGDFCCLSKQQIIDYR